MFRRQMINSVRALVRQCSDAQGGVGGLSGGGMRNDIRLTEKRQGDKSVNNVTLVGRLAKDVELRESATGGMPFIRFTLVTNNTWRAQDGGYKTIAEFHNVLHFSLDPAFADVLTERCKTGDKVYVQGRLSYTSSVDQTYKLAYIRANEVIHLAKSYKRQQEELMAKQEM